MKIVATLALVIAGVAHVDAACDVAAVALNCAKEATEITHADHMCEEYSKYLTCQMKQGCTETDALYAASVKLCKAACKEAECVGTAPSCFPASATVQLADGVMKNMDQLKVGDKVHVGNGKYSEVYVFSTELTETSAKFVKLSTAKTEVSLTAGHYVYANGKLVQASTVQVGDELVLADGSKSAVVSVSSTWASGLYNPHTMTGDIVVDGVMTSTYTDAVHPKLAHALLFPVRQLYNAGVTFGAGFNAATKSMPSWILKAIQA